MTHRMLHELTDDLAICPMHVTAVKRGLTKDTATVFLVGQGEQEGFTVEMSWEEVVDSINAAISEMLPKELEEEPDGEE